MNKVSAVDTCRNVFIEALRNVSKHTGNNSDDWKVPDVRNILFSARNIRRS